jgi:hypothetical protein
VPADETARASLRRIAASFGFEVGSGALEVPASATGARALERALSWELLLEDCVRMYPVCSRCRDQARLWGDGELAGLSQAIIF